MPKQWTDYLDLETSIAYVPNHLRRICSRADAVAAIKRCKTTGIEAFSLTTFYRWKRRECDASMPMLDALAWIKGMRVCLVSRTKCTRRPA